MTGLGNSHLASPWGQAPSSLLLSLLSTDVDGQLGIAEGVCWLQFTPYTCIVRSASPGLKE